MHTAPIIVFDSGKGGQSIYNSLKKLLPEKNIVYQDDSSNFPYGNKTSIWIQSRLKEIAKNFAKLDPELVILACNSATTNAIELVRKELNCPVIGVEPVIKPLSKYKNSLALMTQASASSIATKSLLKKYGQHVQVYASIDLAEAIEYNNNEQVKKSLNQISEIVKNNNITSVGLSCTHYSLIIKKFEKAMPKVRFIDPTEAVVAQAIRMLR